MNTPKKVAITIAGNTFYGREALQGMLLYRLQKANWNVHYEGTTEPEALRRTAMAVTHWKADGLLIQLTDEKLGQFIRKSGIPAVDIASQFSAGLVTVSLDNRQIGAKVAEFLIGRGFKDLAYCGYYRDYSVYSTQRSEGFCGVACQAGVKCHVYHDAYPQKAKDWIDELAHLQAWIDRLPKPLGIMVCHDYRAHDVLWTCKMLGLRIPDDVAVVSVGNDNVECNITSPPLSSVVLPARQIGYTAAEILDGMMRQRKKPAQPILLPPGDIALRRSSDITAVEDQDVAEVMRFISAHSGEHFAVKDILGALPISRRGLERRFFKHMGVTLRNAIIRAHVDRAKNLLAETDLKMPIVAQKSGFTQHQVFSQLFKKLTGVNPSQYRLKSRCRM
jgi:LacI family transcriptional regulator